MEATILQNKVAVIYGAGGGIGGGVARAFARAGARVFLTGPRRASVEAVARELGATAAEVDATDEAAIEKHLQGVVRDAGRLDISFNAMGIPDAKLLGVPLTELDLARFQEPLTAYATSYFLTARHAARHMIPRKAGVIMGVSAVHAREGIPLVGGYGPAQAVKEALTRNLSAELSPHGIRVVGLRPYAMPETRTIKNAWEPRAKATGMTWEQWQQMLASRTHPKRLMTTDEVGNAAAFLASDGASGLTGTILNLTLGRVDD